MPGKKQFVEKVGDYTVLTTSINYASTRQLMLKRLMDIAGGLVGCIFTGIICIFVGPAIYIASPGPMERNLKCTSSAVCIWMQKNVRQSL